MAGALRRGGSGKLRRGVTGTAIAAAAMTALTASQAPGMNLGAKDDEPGKERADETPDGASPGDDSYHTELPPLESPAPPRTSPGGPAGSDSGIPATVLAAYKKAARTLAATDRGCGCVGNCSPPSARSSPARRAAEPSTRKARRSTDPRARAQRCGLRAYQGHRRRALRRRRASYDRAVGPMQFIPSTWSRWGADGNGDGRSDPNNVHDAALAAGKYLCAGERSCRSRRDLDRAILSYNNSRDYLRTVLAWFEFYRKGTHEIPDGTGQLPDSPGAGGSSDRPGNGSGNAGSDKPGNGGGGGGHDTPAPSSQQAHRAEDRQPRQAVSRRGHQPSPTSSASAQSTRATARSRASASSTRSSATPARASRATRRRSPSTPTPRASPPRPKLNAGDETGKFFIRVTAPGHDVSHASFYATVEPRADELEDPSGRVGSRGGLTVRRCR